jgi:hypothetical protein
VSLTILYNQPGQVVILPTSIGTSESFGVHTVIPGAVTLFPSAIASSQAFGVATIVPGPVTINPSSISSGEAFGQANMIWPQSILPSSIVSQEAWGTPFMGQFFPPIGRPLYYIARRGRSVRRYTR